MFLIYLNKSCLEASEFEFGAEKRYQGRFMFQKYRLWIFFSVFLLYRSDCYKEKILSSNWFTLVNFDLVVSKGTFVCEGAQCTAHLDSYLAVWSWSSSMTSVTSQVIFFNSKRRMFNFTVIEIT